MERKIRLLLLVLAAGVILITPLPGAQAAPADRTFRIQASSFAFNPAEIKVNQGDHVTLELVSTDVVHGIYVDGYGEMVVADPGQTASVSFVADQPGSFRLRCSVTCGALHPFMIGKLRVGTNSLLWKGLALSVLAAAAGLFWVKK